MVADFSDPESYHKIRMIYYETDHVIVLAVQARDKKSMVKDAVYQDIISPLASKLGNRVHSNPALMGWAMNKSGNTWNEKLMWKGFMRDVLPKF